MIGELQGVMQPYGRGLNPSFRGQGKLLRKLTFSMSHNGRQGVSQVRWYNSWEKIN